MRRFYRHFGTKIQLLIENAGKTERFGNTGHAILMHKQRVLPVKENGFPNAFEVGILLPV